MNNNDEIRQDLQELKEEITHEHEQESELVHEQETETEPMQDLSGLDKLERDLMEDEPKNMISVMTDEVTAIASQTSDVFEILEAGTGAKIRATTTTENKYLFNALSAPSKKVKEFLDEELDIVAIVITSADIAEDYSEKDKEDAKKVSVPCVHFFTLDGDHIASVAHGIHRAADSLISTGITPSEDDPITIRFVEVETKKGTAYSFEWV